MGDTKATPIVVLFSCFLLLVSVPGIAASSLENWNWVEVARITGEHCYLYETEPFNISSSAAVWRIVWEYTPKTDVPEIQSDITIYLYRGASGDDRIIGIGSSGPYNGADAFRYFHEPGAFRLKIKADTQNYTVRVEQSMSYIPGPPSDNWVEVTRFIGTGGFTTDVFVCDYPEWRIRWEYDPLSVLFWEGLEPLGVQVHPEGQATFTVSSITGIGSKDGINYVHDKAGRFYMTISPTFLRSYTIIVEQNIESTPKPESNWVEVVTFHNIVGFWATPRFNIFHGDWRIKWEIYPSNGSESPSLTVRVYHDIVKDIEQISSLTTHETTGILNINNASGKFFLLFQTTNTNSSSILIIERNTDAIPEFPSWAILPIVLTITLFLIVVKRKMSKKRMLNFNQKLVPER